MKALINYIKSLFITDLETEMAIKNFEQQKQIAFEKYCMHRI